MGEHLPETVQDFRTIYGVSVFDAPFVELFALVLGLLSNPASQLHAGIAGWSGPVSAERIVLMNMYDLIVRAKFAAPHTPYPREWDHRVPTKTLTDAEAMAILRPHRKR